MAEVIFYGLADCPANVRQKQQLVAAGHRIDARDLAAQGWTRATLRPFFGDRPVDEWFNRRAPAVKSGAVDPDALGEEAALDAMIADATLIRRPLLEAEGRREAGFDPNLLNAWIGLVPGESCDSKHARGQCDHGHHHFPARAG
ncbi:ArsC/Spx/MgsR family protein [Azospirillum sp. TSO22-1]|uniref:ArsC/Spx/MgsR family protein n=1 Tax=Azospirillum sp. TSO22-1 TaxID=716789 RepID=UPI000D618252|nr:ArsC/Spx/MgsR family protein [Azospirillum sp. TSO22-1]PWC55508.1 nitrogen fixation protein NifO [Azospirillum sp. TSO22-1]